MRLLSKYIFSQIAKNFLAVSLVLSLLALAKHFVKLIVQTSSGKLPPSLLFSLLGYELPDLLMLTLPLGLFLGILLAYGKLYAEQEIPVMLAGGFSWWSLCRIPLGFASLLATALFVLALWLPELHYQKELSINQLGISDRLSLLSPGRFHLIGGGHTVVYVEAVDPQQHFSKVFIAEQTLGDKSLWSLFLAATGAVEANSQGDYYFTLEDGLRYEGSPGHADFHITKFHRYGQLLNAEWSPVQVARRMMSFKDLAITGTPADWAEIQSRLAAPLSVFILVALAVPLSRVGRGQGRYAKLLIGLLLFIVYFNGLSLAKRFIMSGLLPAWIGLWAVHICVLILALYLGFKQGGFSFRRKTI